MYVCMGNIFDRTNELTDLAEYCSMHGRTHTRTLLDLLVLENPSRARKNAKKKRKFYTQSA